MRSNFFLSFSATENSFHVEKRVYSIFFFSSSPLPTENVSRAQAVCGHVEQEVQWERCETNVLEPWDNRRVHSAARSIGSEQGLRLCDILNQTICHWCYQSKLLESANPPQTNPKLLSRLSIKVKRWKDVQRRWSWSSLIRRRRRTPSASSRSNPICGTSQLALTVRWHRRRFLSHRQSTRIRQLTLVPSWHQRHSRPRPCNCCSRFKLLGCNSSCWTVRFACALQFSGRMIDEHFLIRFGSSNRTANATTGHSCKSLGCRRCWIVGTDFRTKPPDAGCHDAAIPNRHNS